MFTFNVTCHVTSHATPDLFLKTLVLAVVWNLNIV